MQRSVLIVGAGAMGAGIAQVCAQAGWDVTLSDVEQQALDRARGSMRSSLERLARKGVVRETPGIVLRRVRPLLWEENAPESQPDLTLAIEAVPEDLGLKRRILAALETACGACTIIATNTSGIPITTLSEELTEPGRMLGMHFFNPPALMKVVEVIQGEQTTSETFQAAAELVREMDREPVLVRRDLPGFVLNRVAMTASNEAIRLVQEGVVTAEDLDRGVRGAFGWRMGPLETVDLVGLDVVLAAREEIFRRTADPRFEPPALLRDLVERGHLGRKTGRGFFRHEDGKGEG